MTAQMRDFRSDAPAGLVALFVKMLRRRDLPVRAPVRREDEPADALLALCAGVVVGDLTRSEYVARALAVCRGIYFGMSLSTSYLEATVSVAAAASRHGPFEVFVNISQIVDQITSESIRLQAAQNLRTRMMRMLSVSLPVRCRDRRGIHHPARTGSFKGKAS